MAVKRKKTNHSGGNKSNNNTKQIINNKHVTSLLNQSDDHSVNIPITEPDTQELELTKLLFGNTDIDEFHPITNESLDDTVTPIVDTVDTADSNKILYAIDTAGETVATDTQQNIENKQNEKITDVGEQTDAVWSDPNDAQVSINIANVDRLRKLRTSATEDVIDGIEYNKRTRFVYNKLNEHNTLNNWATKAQANIDTKFLTHSDVATNRVRHTHTSQSSQLPSSIIDIVPLKDGNINEPTNGVVHSVGWHCNGHVMFTAGMDKTVKLFNIDGVKNKKLHGIHINDLPIRCARITHDGSEIVVSGRRPFFYTYNIDTGNVLRIPGIRGVTEKSLENFEISPDSKIMAFTCNNGYVALVERHTKQAIGSLKMSSLVRSIAFSPDSQHLYAYTDESDIYVWDIAARQCIYRHNDNAGVHGQTITVANNGLHYATASDSGIVNIYATDQLHKYNETTQNQPIHTLTNITTPVDTLLYNHDSQLLCASSRRIKDVFKLYNVTHNYSSFTNWPTVNTPLHYVSCSAFSPNSAYLSVGNDRGRVLLYRLKHYNAM